MTMQDSEKGSKIVGHTQEGRSISGKSAGDVHWASLRELPDDVVLLEDSNEASILYTVRCVVNDDDDDDGDQ